MANLLWFHAYRRKTVDEMITVLTRGADPTPPGLSRTRMNEARLGLPPASYVYLGRTHEDFGSAAFALEQHNFMGLMSPFDTGGTIENIKPLAGWADKKRASYVAKYSWSTADFEAVVGAYPAADPAFVAAYVAAERPSHAGPHAIWLDRPKADIWLLNDDWRAWTWEGRCAGPIQTGYRILHWSCQPHVFDRIQQRIEDASTDFDLLVSLTSRYVPGGVSALIDKMRAYQKGSK
jgi:hypothetical protein